jgi:predicted lipid carrier protein YhbT
MPEFLTQEWLELQRTLAGELPERPGASARLQIVVTGTPQGEVRYVQAMEDGRLVECVLGADDAVDATLTETYADAVAIARGELDANVAFMQGRVKVVGDMGRLMAIMPVLQSAAYREVVAAVAERTEV